MRHPDSHNHRGRAASELPPHRLPQAQQDLLRRRALEASGPAAVRREYVHPIAGRVHGCRPGDRQPGLQQLPDLPACSCLGACQGHGCGKTYACCLSWTNLCVGMLRTRESFAAHGKGAQLVSAGVGGFDSFVALSCLSGDEEEDQGLEE